MTIVTGIPGHGKSNFIDSLMLNLISSYDWPFAVFSPENWPLERHMQTLLEKAIGKPFARKDLATARMTKEEIEEYIGILNDYIHFIMPKEDLLSVDVLLEKVKVVIFRHGIKGFILDPWNEVEHNFGKLTETQYISQELTKIRRFAKLNQIHVWIIAHPRNLRQDDDGGYKPPTMYEISGGANWRNKADNGLCIHRPDLKVDETSVFVQKIRFKEVGKMGEATLNYCRDTGEYI